MSDPEAAFARLLRRARALEQLNARVAGLLGTELGAHCRVANLRDGQLVFACDSASCATRLRMQAPSLLPQLHALGLTEIEAIEVRMTLPSAAR